MKCLDCSLDAVPGSKRCLEHRTAAALRRADAARLDAEERRLSYAALGLCVQCGDPRAPDSVSRCRRCLDLSAAAARIRRSKVRDYAS